VVGGGPGPHPPTPNPPTPNPQSPIPNIICLKNIFSLLKKIKLYIMINYLKL